VVVYVWVVGVTTVEKWLEIISEKFERDDREGVFFSANVFFFKIEKLFVFHLFNHLFFFFFVGIS